MSKTDQPEHLDSIKGDDTLSIVDSKFDTLISYLDSVLENTDDTILCPDFNMLNVLTSPQLPTFSLERDNDRILASLKPIEENEDNPQSEHMLEVAQYAIENVFDFNIHNIDRHIHDAVFRSFCLNEKPLSTISTSTLHDDYTPDSIIRTKHGWVVLEYTTLSAISETTIVERFQQKLNKYYEALRVRGNAARTKIFFGIICVTTSRVCTNLPLDQLLVDSIIYLLRLYM